MRILTILLRLILILIIAILSHFTFYFFPYLLSWMHESHASMAVLISFGFFLFSSAICSYGIILFAWRLLYLVDHQRSFSASSAFALKVIKYFFYYIAAVYFLAFFDFGALANIENAPAPFVVEIFVTVLAISLGLFVNLLQRINQRVEEIS